MPQTPPPPRRPSRALSDRNRLIVRLLVGSIAALLLFGTGFAVVAVLVAPEPRTTSTSSPSGTVEADALDQMAVAFAGSYDRDAIAARLREAMDLYGTPWSEDQRSRAGSVLVALRQDYDVEEMRILDYMICSHVPDMDFTFPEAAAMAVTFLQSGDGCR